MGDEQPPGVLITVKDIYDEVTATRTAVGLLALEVKESRRTDEDHEGRIRSLERWMYGIPVSLLVAIIGAVVAFYKG